MIDTGKLRGNVTTHRPSQTDWQGHAPLATQQEALLPRLGALMTTLSSELAAAVRRLDLPKTAFRQLGTDGCDHVLAEVARRYVRDLNRRWWWEAFRCRGTGVVFNGTATRHWLSRLLETPNTTCVWLIVGVDEPGPELVYSGTVANVEAVLDECYYMEYYVMAHGYFWFACQNHHDLCYALGFPLMRR